MKNRIIKTSLGILVVIAAAFILNNHYGKGKISGGLDENNNALPTISPTALPTNISTEPVLYTNPQKTYQITIPSGWIIKQIEGNKVFNSPSNEAMLKQIESGQVYGEGYSPDLTIMEYSSVAKIPDNESNNLQAKTLLEYLKISQTIPKDFKKITINGLTAYDTTVGGLGTYEVIYIQGSGGKIFELFFGTEREDDSKDYSYRDKIIQSFKEIK